MMTASSVLWIDMLKQGEHGLSSGSPNAWADWVVHITQINTFLDWPFKHWLNHSPFIGEGNFRYPPLANLFGAILVKLGLSLPLAMTLSSYLMHVALIASLLLMFQRFIKNWAWAAIATLLFFLNGGVGIWFALTEGLDSATHLPQHGIIIQNFVISEFIPQRAILFAAPFFISSLILLDRIIRSEEKWPRLELIAFALFSNIILLSSMHTYISLVLVSVVVAAMSFKKWQSLVTLGAICGITNLSIYAFYYSINQTQGFIQFKPGELINSSNISWWKYWLFNYGLILPIALWGAIRYQLWKNTFVIAGIILFTASYLWQFQPWIWDNTKLLTWAYVLLLIPVVILFKEQWNTNNRIKQTLIGLVLICTMASGSYDIGRLLKPDHREYEMFTKESQILAQKFKEMTTPETLTLTHMNHANWIHALAARQVFQASPGWLWSWGLNLDQSNDEKKRMLNGDIALMKEKSIEYFVIDLSHNRSEINLDAFKSLPLALKTNKYRVYFIPPH